MKRFLREAFASLTLAVTVIFGTVNVYASSASFDTSKLTEGIKTGLIAVVSIVGGGLAVFGVIHLIEAQSSNDPNAKTQAIKQLASGLGLIIVGAILIPIFTDAIKF